MVIKHVDFGEALPNIAICLFFAVLNMSCYHLFLKHGGLS